MESFPASVTFGRCFLHLFKTTCAVKKYNAVSLFFDSFLNLKSYSFSVFTVCHGSDLSHFSEHATF